MRQMNIMISEILTLVKKHEKWRSKQCLNLIPSENVMSPTARNLLSSELTHRYTARDHFYMGTHFIDELEEYGEELARKIFKSETADLRPLSGHIADLIVLANFTKPGDTLMCLSPENGGYPGMWREGLSGLLKLNVKSLPFSIKDRKVPINKARNAIKHVKPKALIFGGSLIPFPSPVKELADDAKEVGAFVGFDGSHVLGLIAGQQFQAPLKEGAYALFGSTHKSFFGPQGGIILADEEHGRYLKEKIYPAFVDNAHWNRIVALTLALEEMKTYGKAYARQVVRNSQCLAKALSDYGFPVVCKHLGFTQSHQSIIDYGNYSKGRIIAERLQKANIITDCAIRVGTCEVTRRGMREEEMAIIAELMKRTVMDNEPADKIKQEVGHLVGRFQRIEYCFD
jgi:glycine hydroxymethyltransferase